MRKGLITLVCVAGLMLWGGTAVNAIEIDWTLLEHASVAGKGPGPDGVIGTNDDTTTGEVNSCNFTTAPNCPTAGNPTIGSYSFSAIEFSPGLPWSCLDPSGGPTAGAPCICAEGGTCTSDADCSSGSCAGAGDCCPGLLNTCTECVKVPGDHNDSFSYFGSDPSLGPAPHYTTCQVNTTNDFAITAYQTASTESLSGAGGTCITLNLDNDPYAGSPCGVGAISGTLDVDVYAVQCAIIGATINNIAYTGRVVDMDAIAAVGECGYNLTDTTAMVNNARSVDPTAEYLMVLCGNTTVPSTSKTACLANADVDFVLVSYTSDDASDCSGTCP